MCIINFGFMDDDDADVEESIKSNSRTAISVPRMEEDDDNESVDNGSVVSSLLFSITHPTSIFNFFSSLVVKPSFHVALKNRAVTTVIDPAPAAPPPAAAPGVVFLDTIGVLIPALRRISDATICWNLFSSLSLSLSIIMASLYLLLPLPTLLFFSAVGIVVSSNTDIIGKALGPAPRMRRF